MRVTGRRSAWLTNSRVQTPHFQGVYWPLREQARSHGLLRESRADLCITLSAEHGHNSVLDHQPTKRPREG
ncbi:hypothetical protein B1F73_24660 [Pseudomonas syringae]|nr:hypothetical protein B1F77_24160 [Pseudomonas syringae]RXT86039.1 hypothetical protein B1F72_08610 [Pseudomonas syringae]RXT94026.1 hypothetical protein B1F73_24660 [Pseudomonas syringae]RXU25301.1 hypothetical protein B0A92_10550 [Pseudomonas syringae]